MKILSISSEVPSLKIANGDLLNLVRSANSGLPKHRIDQLCEHLERHFDQTGAQTRYYRDLTRGETGYSLLRSAIRRGLERAQLDAPAIDLIVYCGVGRGFLEPAMSYLVAADLNINCECFDVLDACMGWVRALYLIQSLFRERHYRHVLLVNSECSIYECGYPALATFRSDVQWSYSLAAFTIGEAATATIVSAASEPWDFHFRSFPTNVDLCAIPLTGYDSYAPIRASKMGSNGVGRFMCASSEMARRGKREMSRFIKATYSDVRVPKWWFPHLASAKPYHQAGSALGISTKAIYTHSFAEYGNVVSASIPLALSRAEHDGELRRGDHIVLCPISAGMSLALVDFVY